MAVLGLQILDHHLGLFDLRGIKLTFHRKAHLAILEAVENVGFGDGFNAVVLDAADDRPLDHVKDHDFGIRFRGAVLHLEADVLEILGVPKRLEVAAQRFFIVRIAASGEDARLQRLGAYPAISLKLNAIDRRGAWLLRGRGGRRGRRRGSGLHAGSGLRPQGQRERDETEYK